MPGATLDFKANSSALRRTGAIALILGVVIGIASAIAYMVSSAVGYVNQPPFQVYTSNIGKLSITYPTGMVLEKNMYGENINLATFRSSYNTIDSLDSNKGKGLLMFVTARKIRSSYKTMAEEIAFETKTFKEVYFYDDPENPNALKEAQEYATVTRKQYTKTINGHEATVYDIVEQDEYSSTEISGYSRHVLMVIPDGDILYLINVQTSEKTDVLDAMLQSISIGENRG